jgi:hypothetical protein
MQVASQVPCPSCGAPLPVKPSQRHAICVFCNTSSLIHDAQGAAPPRLTAENVSKEDIERLKQLVLDGKRDEAIDLYAQKAGIARPEAEVIVNDLLLSEYGRLTRSLPINAFGFVLYFGLVGLGIGLAVTGALLAQDSLPYAALVPLGAAFAVWRVARVIPRIASTWVNAYGAEGHARVVRVAVLKKFPDCTLTQVAFDVTPTGGGQRFFDEEILLLTPESAAKLVPNNVVMVRFDEPERRRVFPFSPIQLVGAPTP